MKTVRWLLIGAMAVGVATRTWAAGEESLTLRLLRAFDAAWDRNDVKAMYEMLDPECVMKTPFQTRLGRDAIRDNSFRNAPRFRDSVSTEETSRIDGDIAYSFSTLSFNEYGGDGSGPLKARRKAKHLFIFTRRPGEDWKIRFMITTEETHEPVSEPGGK
jgi:ketosteroid isomerase-like protein